MICLEGGLFEINENYIIDQLITSFHFYLDHVVLLELGGTHLQADLAIWQRLQLLVGVVKYLDPVVVRGDHIDED